VVTVKIVAIWAVTPCSLMADSNATSIFTVVVRTFRNMLGYICTSKGRNTVMRPGAAGNARRPVTANGKKNTTGTTHNSKH
jgi:hypothetical protein